MNLSEAFESYEASHNSHCELALEWADVLKRRTEALGLLDDIGMQLKEREAIDAERRAGVISSAQELGRAIEAQLSSLARFATPESDTHAQVVAAKLSYDEWKRNLRSSLDATMTLLGKKQELDLELAKIEIRISQLREAMASKAHTSANAAKKLLPLLHSELAGIVPGTRLLTSSLETDAQPAPRLHREDDENINDYAYLRLKPWVVLKAIF